MNNHFLQKYSEAEAAFQEVLRFDEDCDDALSEIVKVRRKRIIEMGFTEQQAKVAIKKYNNVQVCIIVIYLVNFNEYFITLFTNIDLLIANLQGILIETINLYKFSVFRIF